VNDSILLGYTEAKEQRLECFREISHHYWLDWLSFTRSDETRPRYACRQWVRSGLDVSRTLVPLRSGAPPGGITTAREELADRDLAQLSAVRDRKSPRWQRRKAVRSRSGRSH